MKISMLSAAGALIYSMLGLFAGYGSLTLASDHKLGAVIGGDGDCFFCDVLTDQCGTSGETTCKEIPSGENEGDYAKETWTGQSEATCGTRSSGADTCDTDTNKECSEQWVCDGIDSGTCTGCNASSTTVSVPTNCNVSGECETNHTPG